MSRTQENSIVTSPVKEKYYLNGRDGKFSFLDMEEQREEGEDANFHDVKFPFHFLLLDADGFRAAGEHDKRKVKSTLGHFKKAPVIKLFYSDNGQELNRGTWQELKSTPGVRFVSVLYGCKPDGTMIELQLKGMAYAEFLTFCKKSGTGGTDPAFFFKNDFFTVKGLKQVATDYGKTWVPDFATGKISKKETFELAEEKDKELQNYLEEINKDGIKAATPEETAAPANDPGYFPDAKDEKSFEEDESAPSENPADDLPF